MGLYVCSEYVMCCASDGVFDVLNNEQVSAVLRRYWDSATASTSSSSSSAAAAASPPSRGTALNLACRQLVADSFTEWRKFGPNYGDNITVSLMHLRPT